MKIKKIEIVIASSLLLLLFASLTMLNIVKWNTAQGDTAFQFQLIDNIQKTGKTESEMGSNAIYYIFPSNIAAMNLDQIKKVDLSMPSPEKLRKNLFTIHSYFILYFFAPLGFIDLDILYPAVIVFSFIFLLFVCYLYLRNKKVPISTSALFVLLILFYPAWSMSVQGQVYPDRLFLGIGFLFAVLCSIQERNKIIFIITAILGSLVTERAGIILGIFAVLHYILYYKKKDRQAVIKLFVGIALIIFSYLLLKFYITYSLNNTYFIKSIPAYIDYLNRPGVIEKLSTFLFFSSIFLVLSIFEWRATIIALVMLLPNLLGNIGGAEKTGWPTHYHTYYFPFLVWAAAVGLTKLYCKTKKWIVNVLLCLLIVLVCVKNPYARGFSFNNLKENILARSINEIKIYFFDGNAGKMMAIKKEFQDSIPAGSKVSAIESAWYPFYKTAYISYYPIGIKEADYAVISVQKINGEYKYGGFFSYHGPEVSAEIDKYLLEKMEEYGYDLKNPVYVSPWGHAVIARKK